MTMPNAGGAPTPAPPSATTMPSNEVAVKVAVRVRPLNNREKLHQHQPCVKISSETNQIIIGKDKIFSFDYVLAPKMSQSELYESCGVKNLVQSLFEGYNATVFAYGQTGSGKTFTISGNKTSIEEVGIIPRAVHTMFQIINSQSNATLSPTPSTHAMSHRSVAANQPSPPREFTVKVNFLEIYKEELKDLLDPTEKELQIREDESGNTIIYGANEITCTTLEEVMACFDAGTLLRHTGSTQMNEQSSRSHSVFTVSIEQRWSDSPKTVRDSSMAYELSNTSNNSYYLGAKFHFVDLAGSERVHRTGNVGDRFKESIHINSGLLALGNVISALSSGDGKRKVTHIPYRESKITRILKDSLGGNANTLMICCISPSSCNLDESINAVKYASRARYIKNKPIVNMDPQTQRFVEMQSEIQALREELHRQRLLSANMSNHPSSASHQRGGAFDDSSSSSSPSVHEVKQLESRLQVAQGEADHYKKIVKEAFNRFKQISKTDFANPNAVKKMADEWLTIFEASKNRSDFEIEDYAKQRISQLESQLQQAHDDLKSDEEIFADKEKEINNLKDMAKNLELKLSIANRYLEESFNKEKEQQELMLQLQIQLDKLMMNKQQPAHGEPSQIPVGRTANATHHANANDGSLVAGPASKALSSNAINKLTTGQGLANQAPNGKQRAKTAPNEDRPLSGANNLRNRNIFSSPALFSLDRVMQNFRARSQLLTETLEENDNVLQKRHFNSTYDIDKNDEANENELEHEDDENKFVRRGTFKVEKTKPKAQETDSRVNSATGSKNPDGKKLRDLEINIKMKEELIKELVANSKFTNRINIQNQHKIDSLQKECNQLKNEVADLQRQLQSNPISKDPSKIEIELRKRLEVAVQKINELESKQKDTAKFLNTTNNSDKKINELEIALGKMKQQNEMLQKKLKDDVEKKMKLEKDFEREQQKLKDLETRNEHQQKILKKKTEDLATAQRRLRSASNCNLAGPNGVGGGGVEENKHWVEQEMEKILQEKRQIELYREELQKREELIKKKELLHQERNELQIKKLRSSQQAKESLAAVDQKLEMLNKQQTHSQAGKELEDVHGNLVKQRKQLDDRLSQGGILSPAEERRLIEIDEAIEALEIAIDYENDSIRDHQQALKDSILIAKNPSGQDEIAEIAMEKLSTIPYEETKNLVKKFFAKIIHLKEAEHKKQAEISELQIQVEEQFRLIEQLKQTLNMSSVDFEKRLIEQKAKSDKNVKILMQQLADCNSKIATLEKEISYYRDKLTKPSSNGQSKNEVYDASNYMPSAVSSNPAAAGGGSFHLIPDSSAVAAAAAASSFLDSNNNASNNKASSSSTIKMSRKDLRPLTNEELLKRSLKKSNMSSLSTVASSALDHGSSSANNNH